MAAESKSDVPHRSPRCLLELSDTAAGGPANRSEFDAEAERWGNELRGLSREDLMVLIEGSTRQIPVSEHRRLHREEGDFVRWSGGGSRKTLALYGRPYFSLLARFRCGRIEVEALIEHRAGSLKGAGGPYSPECVEGAISELRLLEASRKCAQIGLIASSKKRWSRTAMYPSM